MRFVFISAKIDTACKMCKRVCLGQHSDSGWRLGMCRSRDARETNDISTTNHVTVPWRYSCAVMVPGRDFDSGSTTSVLVPTVRGCSMTSCSFAQTETCQCRFIFRHDEPNIFVVYARIINANVAQANHSNGHN